MLRRLMATSWQQCSVAPILSVPTGKSGCSPSANSRDGNSSSSLIAFSYVQSLGVSLFIWRTLAKSGPLIVLEASITNSLLDPVCGACDILLVTPKRWTPDPLPALALNHAN